MMRMKSCFSMATPIIMLFAFLIAGCTPKVSDAAQATIDAISEIGEVTDKSGDAIEEARKAYNALPGEDKDQVSNIGDLKEAEKTYAEIERKIKEQEEIDECIKAIDKIGKVANLTLDDKEDVGSARSSFTRLTTEQKAAVPNEGKLKKAEKKIEEMEEAAKIYSVGDILEDDTWKIEFVDAKLTDSVNVLHPDIINVYPSAPDGYKMVDLEFMATCKISDGPGIGTALKDEEVVCGEKYKYRDVNYYYDDGSILLEMYVPEDSTYQPLARMRTLLVVLVSQEAIADNNSVVANLKVIGQEKTVKIQ